MILILLFILIKECMYYKLTQNNQVQLLQNMEEPNMQKHKQKYNVELRKKYRDQIFLKKRNLGYESHQKVVDQKDQKDQTTTMPDENGKEKREMIIDQSRKDLIEQLLTADYSLDMFPDLVACLLNEDIAAKHRGVIGFRKLLSNNEEPPIQLLVDHKLVPVFIEFMKQSSYPQLRLQAAWTLTNIAAGSTSHCQSIIDKGCLQIFIKLLNQNQNGIVDQAVWAVANIAGDTPKFRDKVISLGGIEPLIRIIESSTRQYLVRQATWALTNLCRGTPLPKYQNIKAALPVLCKTLLTNALDHEVTSDVLWAISYTSQGQKSKIQRVIETGAVPKIVQLCDNQFLSLVIPAMRIMGNISTGNQAQTDEILKAGCIEVLAHRLEHERKSIRRETCWIISNIMAGTKKHISLLVGSQVLMEKIYHRFIYDEIEVRKEICYIFSNMTCYGNLNECAQIILLNNVLECYAAIIKQDQDVKALEMALDTLYTLLNGGEKLKTKATDQNVFLQHFQRIPGVIDRIEQLQYHQEERVYKKIVKLLEKYFTIEEEGVGLTF